MITADRYLDVKTGRYVEHPAIFVDDGGHITSIADARTVRWGADVKHIDLAGKTLLPGLIDMHTHLRAGRHRRLSLPRIYRQLLADRRGRDSARRLLDGGFTTMRVVGSERLGRRRPEAGDRGRLCRSARGSSRPDHALGATGGHCDDTYLPPSLQKKEKEEGIGDSPEELKYQVRRQRKFGAEVIKVCATGGVFSRGDTPGAAAADRGRASRRSPTRRTCRACASRPTPMAPSGINAAIRAGIDTIEHASLLDDESIRLAKARKRPVWFSMDIKNTDYTQAEGKKNGELEENIRKDREIGQIQRDNFRKAHQAGVPMIFGSDAGVMPHATVGQQFAVMVQYGMTPLEAIQAATRNAAEALGRRRRRRDRGRPLRRSRRGRRRPAAATSACSKSRLRWSRAER